MVMKTSNAKSRKLQVKVKREKIAIKTHWSGYGSSTTRRNSIKLCDGTIAQGVSAEWDVSCNWSVATTASPNNIFQTFLDGSADQYLTISGDFEV